MDTARYLKSQGWLGTGHPLSAGRGLPRPLLVSQKLDARGLGKKQNHADQWWARAFDNSLEGLEVQQGNIGADGTSEVTVTQREKGGLLESLVSGKGALYSMFVKGEGLVGTIGKDAVQEEMIKKCEREERSDSREGSKVERRKRKKRKSSKTMGDKVDLIDLEGRGKRRRLRREIKASKLSSLEALTTISTLPLANQQPEGGDTTLNISIVGDALKQEHKRGKKVERKLDVGKPKPANQSTTPNEDGEAPALAKTRRKNRKPTH
ncbi:hypothetical protein FGG08_006632 [Glutinoglossum americanum]|uniref:Uncharacterized protein n=1 Tax=Glutinoglossum americanum TaxID=1670608 RepID=A0A9P8HVM9_9PEZI|nr:hypothetical protein FGG08_006632 [Glutinoglossum americanum]